MGRDGTRKGAPPAAAHELCGRARLPQPGDDARAAAFISSVIAVSGHVKVTEPVDLAAMGCSAQA